MKRRITVIGGGTGSYNVLTALRQIEDTEIRSIVTMMDSGGDSGRLRDEFGVLPPGDARRCLVALSEEQSFLRELFNFRFTDAPLEGRSLGNLLVLAATKICGAEEEAIDKIGHILKIRGSVIAVTLDHSNLHAVLEDGQIIAGEKNIDVPQHDASIPISRVYLEPEAVISGKARQAIEDCDCIILAPGNLYTSTIPNLLVKGVPEAIQGSKAPLVYIMNLMTVSGETNGYTGLRHIEEISNYGGRIPDAVLVHDGAIPPELESRYKSESAVQVEVDYDSLHDLGVKSVEHYDLMCATSFIRHDPIKIASALSSLFQKDVL